jgi:A/G-specific adenine glycosylase
VASRGATTTASTKGFAKGFAAALLAHHDQARRDLPWRRERSAYRTLVSELMLQQTVVATVIPYFQRFVARFPDVATLAAATEEEVLTLWSGLGYYSRGRNLSRAARVVMEQHGGRLPDSEAALRALPGVGPYTAAAIAAIAFGQRALALDGNVARVLTRVLAVTEPIDRPAVRERLRAAGLPLVPAERPGDFAEALMELGALICVPARPRCHRCPVLPWCQARAQGIEQQLPVRLPRRAKRVVRLACGAVMCSGQVLLVRHGPGTLLGNTWTLPSADCDLPPADGEAAALAAVTAVGLHPAGRGRSAGAVRHVFTHRDVTAEVYRFALATRAGEPAAGEQQVRTRWVDLGQLDQLALSSFTRKTLALLDHDRTTDG